MLTYMEEKKRVKAKVRDERKYYLEHPERKQYLKLAVRKMRANMSLEKRESFRMKKREHSRKNKEKIKAYKKKNKEHIKAWFRTYMKKRRRNDYNFYISTNLRVAFYEALKRYSTTGKICSSKKYGVNYKAIIEHLKPFPKDIQNYHIDHIIPLSIWDLSNPKHIKKAFAPENFQWLTTNQNIWKNNRLVVPCFVETIK